MSARSKSRVRLVDLKVTDADFRLTCRQFCVHPEAFAETLIKVRLDREIEATNRKVDQLLERIKQAPPGEALGLFDQLDRVNAKLDALTAARWPSPTPESAKPSTTAGEES